MKVKKISCFNGQSEDFIKIIGHDGEIVYIAIDSIISVTVQTDGNVKIVCVHNERYLLQDVDKKQLKELLEYGNIDVDDEEDHVGSTYRLLDLNTIMPDNIRR